jgi:uncharacterized protein (DUF433 family)
MVKEYVEQRETVYYIAGSRVSLASVVHAFLRGESPEEIADSFPAINLEQVFGAIAFYLANRELIDPYFQQGKADFARLREAARKNDPAFHARLEAARRTALKPTG